MFIPSWWVMDKSGKYSKRHISLKEEWKELLKCTEIIGKKFWLTQIELSCYGISIGIKFTWILNMKIKKVSKYIIVEVTEIKKQMAKTIINYHVDEEIVKSPYLDM